MKRVHFSLKITTVLAGLALSVWSGFAHASTADTPASTAKNIVDQSAPSKTAPASKSIHFLFDETPLDRSNQGPITSYADMLDKVTPGVVGIYPSRKIVPVATSPARRGRGRGYNFQTPTPPPDTFWTDAESNRYRVMGVGSGCIISADGYIVTNHHVVTDDQTDLPEDGFLVKLPDGREFEGKLIGSDELTDLALIKISAKNLPVIKMADSEKIKVGDVVFAVGNPMDVGLTVTHGIVSAMGRSKLGLLDDPRAPGVAFEDFIQTDASVNPGNSGGPLVDAQGRLIGLNTAIVTLSPDASSIGGEPGGGSIGINFAIPSALVRKVADDLIKDGRVHRGALGLESQDVTRDMAQVMGLPNTHGALVDNFDVPNSPAATSGLKPGDVIVKINNDEVDSRSKLRYLVALAEPGSTINLTVLRNGQPKDFKIRLIDREEMLGQPKPTEIVTNTTTPSTPLQLSLSSPLPALRNDNEILTGVSLLPLTADLRKQLDLPADLKSGLVVNGDVTRNSPFYYEFRNRISVITEVNQKPVSTVDQLRAQLKPGEINLFYVYQSETNGSSAGWSLIAKAQPPAK